jgi:hypothetical protein
MKKISLFGLLALLMGPVMYSQQSIPCKSGESLTDLLITKKWRNYDPLMMANHSIDKEDLSNYEFDFKEQFIAISTNKTPSDVLESKSDQFLEYCVINLVSWPQDIVDIDQRAFLLAYQTQ